MALGGELKRAPSNIHEFNVHFESPLSVFFFLRVLLFCFWACLVAVFWAKPWVQAKVHCPELQVADQ